MIRLPSAGTRVAVGLLALAALLWAWSQLQHDRDGVQIEQTQLGTTPVTVFRPAHPGALLLAIACVTAFGLLAVGVPVDLFLFNLEPTPER